MMIRRLAAVTTGLALGLAVIGVGVAPAHAASAGQDTTGTDRACHVHILNGGASDANGQECAPSLTIVTRKGGIPGQSYKSDCFMSIAGSGLLPGGVVEQSYSSDPYVDYYNVAPDGTFGELLGFNNTATLYYLTITVPTATGGFITKTVPLSC